MLQSPTIFLQHTISDGVICVFGRQAGAGVASQRASKLKTMMERQRAMARCYLSAACERKTLLGSEGGGNSVKSC
jgi:hypothetical protein